MGLQQMYQLRHVVNYKPIGLEVTDGMGTAALALFNDIAAFAPAAKAGKLAPSEWSWSAQGFSSYRQIMRIRFRALRFQTLRNSRVSTGNKNPRPSKNLSRQGTTKNKCGDKGCFHEHTELSRGMGPEAQIPLALLPREGSVSGVRKGPRLPAFEGIDGNMSRLLRAM